jgi:release factor glutamine methyltransferase
LKISTLKNNFLTVLSKQYPLEEVNAFFTILSEKILNLTRLQVALYPDKEISEEDQFFFNEAIEKLKQYKPIQYIVGETEFFGLPFKVNEHTLIPRPETEELVSWIINDYNEGGFSKKNILDIGTGSGCIAVSLAKNIVDTSISAIDISFGAIEIAKQNAIFNNVDIEFIRKDILNTESLNKNYDIIVSNPPYVRELEKEMMQANVLNHEPASALFVSNENPLLFYKKIAQLAKDSLPEGGILYFEINEYLSKDLKILLTKLGFSSISLKKDLFGKDRMMKAYK